MTAERDQAGRPGDRKGAGTGTPRGWARTRRAVSLGMRFTSLRLRLVLVFALVALTAAVSASGIAYWLNREAVLTRAQDAALNDFQQEMQNRAGALPGRPTQTELENTAGQMATSNQHFSVLLIARDAVGDTVVGNSDLDTFSLSDVPESLREAVDQRQRLSSTNKSPYHLYWQRISDDDTPYLVAGTRLI
ncbi:two-component sensor histidine kinase, partial [Streptomyces massasporeus]